MVFKDLRGREVDISINQYRVDWDHQVSKPQKQTKDFLRRYWGHDIVCEELRIPRTKMRIDLININKGIVVEVSPESSHSFNAFFHGSLSGFRNALKRDLKKAEWVEANGFTLVELNESDFPLTEEAFARQDVIL